MIYGDQFNGMCWTLLAFVQFLYFLICRSVSWSVGHAIPVRVVKPLNVRNVSLASGAEHRAEGCILIIHEQYLQSALCSLLYQQVPWKSLHQENSDSHLICCSTSSSCNLGDRRQLTGSHTPSNTLSWVQKAVDAKKVHIRGPDFFKIFVIQLPTLSVPDDSSNVHLLENNGSSQVHTLLDTLLWLL